MNKRVKNLISNFSYSISSNLVSILISTLVILVVPKLIGVEEYGYWQLYLFYSAYVGFLHFGWNDGIYLRYGGEEYNKLDKKVLYSQFYMLVSLQIMIAISTLISSSFFRNLDKQFIFQMIALNLLLFNTRSMLLFILQGSNRIKQFAQITLLDRILYVVLIFSFLFMEVRDYKILIIADLIAKLVSLFHSMYYCRDIVFKKTAFLYFNIKETFRNINAGLKLMLANISNMLIIGVVRFGIERSWDVVTFGKVSLILSISNLMLVFTNAIGIVIFPILKKIENKKLADIYVSIKNLLIPILLGLLIAYFPVKTILTLWLSDYQDTLKYMIILFPMFVYEGKTTLLINTYLKTLRREKLMLKVNLFILALSVITTAITTLFLKNLEYTILSIIVLLILRAIIAEFFLSKLLGIRIFKDAVLELLMILIFIFVGWFMVSWQSILIYTIAYILYLFIKKTDILYSINSLKDLMKS